MIASLLRRRGLQAEVLHSPRLQLVTMTHAMLEAETEPEPAPLADLLGVRLPAGWPPALWEPAVWMHIAAQLEGQPETVGWHRYMVSAEQPYRLIGCLGAFPCGRGDAELGYSVAAEEQGKGFASEAAQALSSWLLKRPEVRSVSAQAYEKSLASVRVMQHCGMVPVGVGDHPGTVRYRRWRA